MSYAFVGLWFPPSASSLPSGYLPSEADFSILCQCIYTSRGWGERSQGPALITVSLAIQFPSSLESQGLQEAEL